MSVSVSMPQLGESVTEGTVTRWLKKEGDRVERDEPLLEISTDKVDTEIPSPAAGILSAIAVAEDETVAVGAELATIDDGVSAGGAAAAPASDGSAGAGSVDGVAQAAPPAPPAAPPAAAPAPPAAAPAPSGQFAPPPAPPQAPPAPPQAPPAPPQAPPAAPAYSAPAPQSYSAPAPVAPPAAAPVPAVPAVPAPAAVAVPAPAAGAQDEDASLAAGPDGPYVTPLVRKLAAEHNVELADIAGTGVGGRIRKQDVLEAARTRRDAAPQPQAAAAQAPAPAAAGHVSEAPQRPAVVPSSLRGTTEHMSRLRQVIAKRMVESLQTSAQLTTVVEADVTEIARLRQRAKAEFEAREGVRLTFLPFFAQAALEALKVHPKLNAILDTQNNQVTYHDAEHLGIAVDTPGGLIVPVIRNAGDLNIGGLARKIADLAQRTRDGQVSPDELAGGTFTLTNTGSRGALFDTPIINQPQVAILGTGTVVKRPVVVDDPELGEVIAVRSIIYLALTYDHRLVDGADAARFLTTVKTRLEEGAFEAELGL
jgi:2-oxoglutarate dehydrogenase E2 component (dihydrolipoamide succinyltransferase)